MSIAKYLRESWNSPADEVQAVWKQRLIQWRDEPSVQPLDGPTRLDRAHRLGYKAKQGVVMCRVRVRRGGHFRPKITGGRRPKTNRRMKIVGKSYQWIAEERAARKYPNCEVLNSYFVAQDGRNYWCEVILVDRSHPSVQASRDLAWVSRPQHRGRVFRGLTAAGKRSRGILIRKGKGAEKLRPSLRAHKRLAK